MATAKQSIVDRISEFEFNPVAIQRLAWQMVDEVNDGTLDVVDPSNPFVLAVETSAFLAAAAMSKTETCTRLQYPRSALTYEDLYPHMSDADYVGRFATPAATPIVLMLTEEEALLKMVADPNTGIRKLVIPRNTYFTVGGVHFSIQYPIEIRQLVHGGINIVYDTNESSPLEALSTNVVDWIYATDLDGVKWIHMTIDTVQFDIVTSTTSITNGAVAQTVTKTINDAYYFTRVYTQNDDSSWNEIHTTHTDLTFDVTTPTALLTVTDQQISVYIPQIYVTSGQVRNAIRVDIYETKGPLNLLLASYTSADWSVNWFATDTVRDINGFTAPLATIQKLQIYSNSVVNGGSPAIPFQTLRDQVIRNAVGVINQPITPDQIQTAIEELGYAIVKNVDQITNRDFLATRPMPIPTNNNLITAAAASIETVSISMATAALHPKVIDNGTSITLTPDIVYQIVNGVTNIVSQNDVDALLALPVDQLALQVTNSDYLTSPFHYVLDASEPNLFAMRAYYLDSPVAETKLFISENDTTLLQVATDSYTIDKTTSGFKLTIATKSDDNWKALEDTDVFVQLAFTPFNERDRAYVMGTLIGKSSDMERIYTFDLSSTLNVNADNNIELTQFMMFDTTERITVTPLFTGFDVVYGTTSPMSDVWVRDEADDVLGMFLLPSNAVGITHEVIRITFGQVLDTLWAKARSMVSSLTYKTWPIDIPRTYENDVYAPFPDGLMIHIVDGTPTYNLVFHQGDPVLDEAGNPILLHHVGDPVLDELGDPIPVDTRSMIRQCDIMMLEGAYHFATDSISVGYRIELIDTLITWITGDLEELQQKLLEETRVYFYPKTTMGIIDVIVEDGLNTVMEAGQSFQLTLYVPNTVYSNETLKAQLTNTAIMTISSALNNVTLSVSEIITLLTETYGTDVLGLKLSGFGTGDVQTLTIVDDSQRFSIRKRLVAQPDNTLIVDEDITVAFVRHQLAN